MKKQSTSLLHLNGLTIIGGVLLLPLIIVFSIDVFSRLMQRDFMHYNRATYNFLIHTPFYWYPVLFTWAILFPLLAVLISFIPLVNDMSQKHFSIFHRDFFLRNLGSIAVLVIGVGFLAILRLHDFAPCMVHGLFRVGIGQLPHVLAVCRNA